MSTETLGWFLVIGPLAVIWLAVLALDWEAGLVVVLASLAAGVLAGTMAYGLMLAGVV